AAAAHYVGAGELRVLILPGAEPVQRANFRVAIVSGAFDNDMMCPGCRYGQSFIAAEKVFVTRNRIDSTLERWPDISWRGRKAIGTTGIDANCLGEHAHKLCQQTLTDDVEESHYIEPHLESERFMSMLCCISFPPSADGFAGQAPSGPAPQRSSDGGFITPGEAVDALRDLVPLPGRAWQRRGILP
ncbi:MAG TPA: hypothetical protein VF175_11715, partial [Lacipirellula sp.]